MSEILRKTVSVERRPDGVTLILECGHAADCNQIYDHRVGDLHHCYPCNHGGRDVWGNSAPLAVAGGRGKGN